MTTPEDQRVCMHCHRPLLSRIAWSPEGWYISTACGCDDDCRESPFFMTAEAAELQFDFDVPPVDRVPL